MTQDPDSQLPGNNNDLSGVNPPPATQDQAGDLASGMRPETADFLNDLAGIGTGAYLAMRQSDPPAYEDWRDQSFVPDDSGNYVSRQGQAYNDDDLERMHGILSRHAGNPLVSNLFAGPKSALADYMTWRSQNYYNDNKIGGAWEDEDGNIYSEPALQERFAAKFGMQPGGREQPEADADEAQGQNQQPALPAQGIAQAGPAASPQTSDSLKQVADFEKWKNQNFRQRADGQWEGPDARLYTDQDLRSVYAIRQQQWPKQQAQSAQSSGTTATLTYPNGTIESRTGNHPQRDNNPGNIEAGNFTKSQGAIGKDSGFVVFPSSEAGWIALDNKLRSSVYQNLGVDAAIAKYAPRYDKNGKVINDTPKYQRAVRNALGVTGDTKLSALTPQQFETLKQTVAQAEGFYEQRTDRKVKVIIQPPKRPDVIPRN